MYQNIIRKIENKKVAIWGFGKEGQSTYHFIRRHLPNQLIYILDNNQNILESFSFLNDDKNINIITGDGVFDDLDMYDVIIKAPGVRLVGRNITSYKDKLTSQIGMVLEDTDLFVIGVTASKGKTTTTTLIHQILKDQEKDSYLLGNMGHPPFDHIEDMTKDSILTIEMSAHHLEFAKKGPNIGCILNLFEEHLDAFGGAEPYYKAKLNILLNQSASDYGIYCSDNITLEEHVSMMPIESKLWKVMYSKENDVENNTTYCDDKFVYLKELDKITQIYDANSKRELLGRHNLEDIMVALTVSHILKLDLSKTVKTINNFKTIEHRMEKVGIYDEILFYNDAIATIPNATINAIDALKNVDTLIFGGLDRGIDYSILIEYLNKGIVRNLICMPETGTKIGKQIINANIYYVETLEEAVKLSKKITEKNKICLLSPAAASYNQFKNFEEKGTKYKEYVRTLK